MMMRVAVWSGDLSDSYLRKVTQLGADCIDFNYGDSFPGVKEKGYPDLDAVLRIKKKLRRYGLEINRVTLSYINEKFMRDKKDGVKEIENTCKAMKVFGVGGISLGR